jgi:hypothetical protein
MPADRNPAPIHDNSPDDPDLALTPPQRLRAFAEFMAIGLRRLRERPRDAPGPGPAGRIARLRRILRFPHE